MCQKDSRCHEEKKEKNENPQMYKIVTVVHIPSLLNIYLHKEGRKVKYYI